MHRLWTIGLLIASLSAVTWLASLFNLTWISGDQGSRVTLRHGSFSLRACKPGDWSGWRPGFDGGTFSMHWASMQWKPTFQRNARIFVQAQPRAANAPPGTPVISKANVGPYLLVPLYIPVAFGAALMALGWPSHRRRRRGCCKRCGYDLRFSPNACPECGHERASPHRPVPSTET